MATNQRENQRKTRKRRNEQRLQRIIWGMIVFVAAILIVMKVVEVDFNSVKNRFVDENGRLNVSMETEAGAYPYQLDSSKDVKTFVQNDKLNILTGSSVTVLNPKDAKALYTFSHGYANPVMKTAGNYFCTIDQGATRLRLDSLQENIYETTTDNAIVAANVSKSESVIYATTSKDSKSTLVVLNKSMHKVLEREVKSGYIIAVAIDPTGRKCAYAAVNSNNAKLVTTVYTINVGDDAEIASFEFEGCDLLDLRYCGTDLYFVGTNCVYTISSQKKQREVFSVGGANTVCFGYTKNDELLYIYSDYSSASENHLVNISPSGKIRKSIELKQRPKAVTSNANEICVLFHDRVVVYSLTSGEEKGSYKCDDGVANAHKLSSRIFISRHGQVDIIE